MNAPRVLVHTPDARTAGTVMALHRTGALVELPHEQATPEIDDLVARGIAVYADAPDPLRYDEVIRGGRTAPPAAVISGGAWEHVARQGRVTLVGGGPGDPGLLTVAGSRALARADVIVCDRLAPLEALEQARPDARIVHVGKIPRGAFTPQEEINRILVDEARAGRHVVRFKGGDSFVFGRGGEEWEACVDAGVPVDVIPGVSSALAVPALAGVPLTHRSLTQGFTVVSAHVSPTDPRSTLNWPAIAATSTTLVILMGVATLGDVTRSLLDAGMDADTPAAVIENGACPNQRVVRARLADIANSAAAEAIVAPAITVIGSVVDALVEGPRP